MQPVASVPRYLVGPEKEDSMRTLGKITATLGMVGAMAAGSVIPASALDIYIGHRHHGYYDYAGGTWNGCPPVLSFCEETTRFRPLWRNHERAPGGAISHRRIKRRRSPHEITFRQVGIANPCVFDKPVMPHPAVWAVGAAEKYRGAAE